MKIDPSHKNLLELIDEVDRLLLTIGLPESLVPIYTHRVLWQWSQRFDVLVLGRYWQCMLESFGLAAVRGLSGLPCDIDRSVRSLQANVSYYRPKVDEALKTSTLDNLVSACAA